MSQKRSELKAVVSREDIEMVVKRASLAAMTEEGQSEIARASNETRGCVRITAKMGEIIFDASVSRFASRHVVKVGEGSVASVEAEGEACVPAKELRAVISKIPSECRIVLSFISQPSEESQPTTEVVRSLLPDGVLWVGAMLKDKIVSKAEVESYPTEHFAAVDYPAPSSLKVVLGGKAKSIKDQCNLIAFSINPNDLNEIYNKVALFDGGDTIDFVGTDGRRCAIATAKKSGFDKSSDFGVEENGKQIPILIDTEYLNPILAATDDGDVLTVATDEAGEYVYLLCGASSYRMSRFDKTMAMKYPDYKRMLTMPLGMVILVDQKECKIALDMVYKANKERAKYMFFGNEGLIRMSGGGIGAIRRVEGEISYKQANDKALKSGTICLHTDYFCEAVKQMKSEKIKLSFSVDEMKVRVEDEVDPKFTYFMQVMNPSKA